MAIIACKGPLTADRYCLKREGPGDELLTHMVAGACRNLPLNVHVPAPTFERIIYPVWTKSRATPRKQMFEERKKDHSPGDCDLGVSGCD